MEGVPYTRMLKPLRQAHQENPAEDGLFFGADALLLVFGESSAQYFPESKGIFAAGREKDALRLHAAWVSGCAVPEDSAQKTSSCAVEITCFCILKTAKGFKTIKSPAGLKNSTWPDLFALLFQKPLIQLEFLRQIIHQLRLV